MSEKEYKNQNYSLKSEVVETLANADKEEVPEYTQEELDQYRSKSLFKTPDALKLILIKVWFAGAVCYFFLWGLGPYLGNSLDMLFVLGIALGMVTDLLTNNVIRFVEKEVGANDKWMMVPGKKTGSMLLNSVYFLLVVVCVYMLYNLINLGINTITGDMDAVPLGVEPILFGVFCTMFDVLFISIKHLVKGLLKKS
jgi:hypothetical protein